MLASLSRLSQCSRSPVRCPQPSQATSRCQASRRGSTLSPQSASPSRTCPCRRTCQACRGASYPRITFDDPREGQAGPSPSTPPKLSMPLLLPARLLERLALRGLLAPVLIVFSRSFATGPPWSTWLQRCAQSVSITNSTLSYHIRVG